MHRVISFFFFFSLQTSAFLQTLYFPPTTGSEWQKIDPKELGWCEDNIQDLESFLALKETKGYIVLKDGKIVLEKYFGTFTKDSLWYWASAGKTMTAFMVGIAQAEGKLSIDESTSNYLGKGWTSLTEDHENKILIRHQLTMTTGLDDGVVNKDCTLPSCLIRKAEPGTRWAYHNAPYTLLDKVVETAVGKTYNQYFQEKIRNKTGMNGLWIKSGYNNVYVSNLRSMARFGLLLLNKGVWAGNAINQDSTWFRKQIQSSQQLNPSYGYLTWLNGQGRYMLPESQLVFSGSMVSNAPDDMFAALGKNDQKIYVVPSLGLVVVRMGNDGGGPAGINSFDNLFWQKINALTCSSGLAKEETSFSAIFPNPVHSGQPVLLGAEWRDMKELQLLDGSGNLLFSGSGVALQENFSGLQLASGIYFFAGVDAGGKMRLARWVVLQE